MPRIVLKDIETEKAHSVPATEGIIGRDPAAAFVIDGPKSKVVSGRHARVFFQDNGWWIEDTSRNGTILDDERLQVGQRHAIKVGQVIGLGESGPRFKVMALESKNVAATIMELPDLDAPVRPTASEPAAPPAPVAKTAPRGAPVPTPLDPPASRAKPDVQAGKTSAMRRSEAIRAGLHIEESTEPMSPAPDWMVHVVVRATNSNQKFDVKAHHVKFGRAPECNVQVPAEHGASVSRVHAEISIADGGVSVKDCGSRNGTYLNGKRLEGPHSLTRSDLVMLGSGGPTFSVEELHIVKGQVPQPAPEVTPDEAKKRASLGIGGSATDPVPAHQRDTDEPKASKPSAERPAAAGPVSNLRRSFAGVGRTAFFKDVLEDMSQKSARKIRLVVWSMVITTVAVGGGVLFFMQKRVTATEQRMDAERASLEARSDSIRKQAEAAASKLRASFDSALQSSAPRAVLDSLRNALADASARTGMLEQSLTRARRSLDGQLAAGDSARRRADEDMTRLRAEVTKAQASEGSRAALDSLRRALTKAEQRADEVATQVRAVRGSNLAQVSQMNQAAVGLLFSFNGDKISSGSGFAITPSGYFITNKHVVTDDAGRVRDTIYVTMADQKFNTQVRVAVVAIGRDVDLAVVKIPDYRGPYMKKVDWGSTGATQGEPAALIGFPFGVSNAFDDTTSTVVRTSVNAGIFSKIAADRIQFDGFTVGGSSGSPIFNANGEVVAVHRAGVSNTPGLGFAIPVSRVVALLPPDAKSELGLR